MERDVFVEVLKKVSDIEKKYGSLENFVILSTWPSKKHKLILEEDYSSCDWEELSSVYQDLNDLETCDLLDYQNFLGRKDGEQF